MISNLPVQTGLDHPWWRNIMINYAVHINSWYYCPYLVLPRCCYPSKLLNTILLFLWYGLVSVFSILRRARWWFSLWNKFFWCMLPSLCCLILLYYLWRMWNHTGAIMCTTLMSVRHEAKAFILFCNISNFPCHPKVFDNIYKNSFVSSSRNTLTGSPTAEVLQNITECRWC